MQAVARTRTYALALLTAAIASVAVAAAQPSVKLLSVNEALLALAFVALIITAGRFPLHVGPKTKLVVDTSLIFAATLLFPKPWGALIAGLGVLVGHILFGRVMLDALVNVGIVIIEVFCAQGVYLALAGTIPPGFDDRGLPVALAGAGCASLVIERLLLAVATALYQEEKLGRVLSSSWSSELKEDVSLLLLGILTALVVQVQPWALLLTVILTAMVYVSLRNRLRFLSRDAVESLADLIDRRDTYTAGHSRRVAKLAERLAIEMGLPHEEVQTIRAAARVHDIGKLGIDTAMLNRSDGLSNKEWQVVRRHPGAGKEIISRFPEFAGGADDVLHHHERWDGSGYPQGLKGAEIPTGARVIATADAFDAMTSDRPYRRALELETALNEFRLGAGIQWDGQVVAALFRVVDQHQVEAGTLALYPVFQE